jgi:hypothetical protein
MTSNLLKYAVFNQELVKKRGQDFLLLPLFCTHSICFGGIKHEVGSKEIMKL